MLQHFTFAFRYIYFDLLERIVAAAGNNLLPLLKNIPELLPYNFQVGSEPSDYHEGVYHTIDKR